MRGPVAADRRDAVPWPAENLCSATPVNPALHPLLGPSLARAAAILGPRQARLLHEFQG